MRSMKGLLMRSNLERQFDKQIAARLGHRMGYELVTVEYTKTYTPDFIGTKNLALQKAGKPYYVIEVKGRFWREDAAKLLAVKRDNPLMQIVLVFQHPDRRIGERKFLTYRAWAKKNHFLAYGIDEISQIPKEALA